MDYTVQYRYPAPCNIHQQTDNPTIAPHDCLQQYKILTTSAEIYILSVPCTNQQNYVLKRTRNLRTRNKRPQKTNVTITLLNLVLLHPILNRRDAMFHGDLVAALRLMTTSLYDDATKYFYYIFGNNKFSSKQGCKHKFKLG